MKKSKILIPVATTASLLSIAAPIITSCSSTKAPSVYKISEATYIIGNAVKETAYFQADRALETGDTITVTADKESSFTYKVSDILNNNIIAVEISKRSAESQISVSVDTNLTFKCVNSSGTEKWTAVVEKYHVVYSTIASISAEARIASTNFSDDANKAFYTYEFDLATEVENVDNIKVSITNQNWFCSANLLETQYQSIAGHKAIEVDNTKHKLYITLQLDGMNSWWKVGQAAANFSMTLSYLDETGSTVVTPVTLTGFQLNYKSNDKNIPISLFDVDKTGNVYVIKGFTAGAVLTDYNTLRLPTYEDMGNHYYTIAANAFDSTKLPDNISNLAFDGVGCIGVGASAFAGTNITYLDLSKYGDDVRGVEDLALGADSFAFATATFENGSGTIEWNTEMSFYKKHVIKTKLFEAGLQGLDWYDYTQVNNEAELRQAAWTGGNIWLNADIELTQELDFQSTSAILDLAGHKITQTKSGWWDSEKKKWSMIGVWDASLIVCDSDYAQTGEGGIYASNSPDSGKANYCFTVRSDIPTREKGNLAIIGGRYSSNFTCIYNWNCDVYIEDWEYTTPTGEKLISVPEFKIYDSTIDADGVKFLLNCKDNTYQSGQANFYCYGGKYFDTSSSTVTIDANKQFNPSDAKCESPRTGETKVNFVPTGYKAGRPVSNDCWQVTKE